MKPRVVVSVGCPSGVGPEVALLGATARTGAGVLLVGDVGGLRAAARGRGIDPACLVRVADPARGFAVGAGRVAVWQPAPSLAARDRTPGRPTRVAGAAQLQWVDAATDLVARGVADALSTGPVSKEAIARSGAPGARGFLGHTEHLQRRLGAREVVMAFWSPRLVTSLVTTHLRLARVPARVTPAAVARATFWLAWLLSRVGVDHPRVVVAALNPHAGEHGLLGDEEPRKLQPGIASARIRLQEAGIAALVDGPVPAESAFRLALARRWDGVVAMYHDQATIPMKVAEFGEAVNVSLGLPIVRTSVDHGTGYDRAGTWTADASGMIAAIRLAARMARTPKEAARPPSRSPSPPRRRSSS